MGTVNINGKTVIVPDGASISMKNNTLYVNGQKYDGAEMEAKEINITIDGNVGDVRLDAGTIIIKGSVDGDVQTTNGSIEIDGNVTGGVKTVNGNIRCGTVGGKVSSVNGNIRHA